MGGTSKAVSLLELKSLDIDKGCIFFSSVPKIEPSGNGRVRSFDRVKIDENFDLAVKRGFKKRRSLKKSRIFWGDFCYLLCKLSEFEKNFVHTLYINTYQMYNKDKTNKKEVMSPDLPC